MSSPLVSFRNVTVVRNGRTALSAIDLTIEAGECVAILGPNGCGKSTLVKVVAGDLRAYAGEGEVTIRGLKRWNLFELRSILGIVSNDLQADCRPEAEGLEIVLSGYFGTYGAIDSSKVTPAMRSKAEEALSKVEAAHLASRKYGELSSGEGRRILIARALVHDPQALLLDEPTTSLDIKAAQEFLATVRKLAQGGIGVILVTHHLEDIVPEIARVVLLRKGRVFADGPKSKILTSKNVSKLFETSIQIHNGETYRAEIAAESECAR